MLTSGQTTGKTSWTSSMTGKITTLLLLVDATDKPFVIFMYTLTDRDGNETKYDQTVPLETTPCNFGGKRYWFLCPVCYSRVGALFLIPGDVSFGCRYCNNITYRSRNRCNAEAFGHTSRQIDQLRSEIKRWTWRGRPTRKARRLQALQRKMEILSGPVRARIERISARCRQL